MRESVDEYSWERRDKLDISRDRVIKTTYIKVVRPKNKRLKTLKSLIVGLQYLASFVANIVTIRNIK